MGNYLLMKTTILILSLALTSNLFCNELSWVDEQIEAIKPSRQGMQKKNLTIIKDPFIFLAKNRGKEDEKSSNKSLSSSQKTYTSGQVSRKRKTTSRRSYSYSKSFKVGLIMNNSVMINGHWYKLGDRIKGYTIKEVNKNTVLLTKKRKTILLSTKSANKNLHFKK